MGDERQYPGDAALSVAEKQAQRLLRREMDREKAERIVAGTGGLKKR